MKNGQMGFAGKVGFIAVVFMLFLAVSCSSKPENAIVGKWSEIGGTEKMELLKDGTMILVQGSKSASGEYKFIDKNRIKVTLGGIFALVGPFVAKVNISGDEMTWTMPDGRASKYKKEE